MAIRKTYLILFRPNLSFACIKTVYMHCRSLIFFVFIHFVIQNFDLLFIYICFMTLFIFKIAQEFSLSCFHSLSISRPTILLTLSLPLISFTSILVHKNLKLTACLQQVYSIILMRHFLCIHSKSLSKFGDLSDTSRQFRRETLGTSVLNPFVHVDRLKFYSRRQLALKRTTQCSLQKSKKVIDFLWEKRQEIGGLLNTSCLSSSYSSFSLIFLIVFLVFVVRIQLSLQILNYQ